MTAYRHVGGTMWIVIGLIIGLIAVVATGVLVYMMRSDPGESKKEMTGDEMFMLGVVFTGSGVALFVSVGPAMLGMLALGIIFMATGAKKKRDEQHE